MNLIQESLSGLVVTTGLLLFSVFQTALANQSYERVVGDAYRLDGTDLLYRETHCGAEDKLSSEVFYQQGDGTLIAHKTLDYKSGPTTPSFVQHDVRTAERIQVSFNQEEIAMSVADSSRRELQNVYPVTDMRSKPIVIDAGFDEFIRQNWDQLVTGQAKEFDFPLASRASLVSLRIKSSICSYETEIDQCFTLEASNWFYRMLASPIELGYDSRLARLNRYRGLSNINDESGNGLIVDIRYRYPPVSGAVCSLDRLQSSANMTNLK